MDYGRDYSSDNDDDDDGGDDDEGGVEFVTRPFSHSPVFGSYEDKRINIDNDVSHGDQDNVVVPPSPSGSIGKVRSDEPIEAYVISDENNNKNLQNDNKDDNKDEERNNNPLNLFETLALDPDNNIIIHDDPDNDSDSSDNPLHLFQALQDSGDSSGSDPSVEENKNRIPNELMKNSSSKKMSLNDYPNASFDNKYDFGDDDIDRDARNSPYSMSEPRPTNSPTNTSKKAHKRPLPVRHSKSPTRSDISDIPRVKPQLKDRASKSPARPLPVRTSKSQSRNTKSPVRNDTSDIPRTKPQLKDRKSQSPARNVSRYISSQDNDVESTMNDNFLQLRNNDNIYSNDSYKEVEDMEVGSVTSNQLRAIDRHERQRSDQ